MKELSFNVFCNLKSQLSKFLKTYFPLPLSSRVRTPFFQSPDPLPFFQSPDPLPFFQSPDPLNFFQSPDPLPFFQSPDPLPFFQSPDPLPFFSSPDPVRIQSSFFQGPDPLPFFQGPDMTSPLSFRVRTPSPFFRVHTPSFSFGVRTSSFLQGPDYFSLFQGMDWTQSPFFLDLSSPSPSVWVPPQILSLWVFPINPLFRFIFFLHPSFSSILVFLVRTCQFRIFKHVFKQNISQAF